MRSRAKRRTVSWNIRSSSLRMVRGGVDALAVSATFGIMPPVYSPGYIIATTGGAHENGVNCCVAHFGCDASGISSTPEMFGCGSGYCQGWRHGQHHLPK